MQNSAACLLIDQSFVGVPSQNQEIVIHFRCPSSSFMAQVVPLKLEVASAAPRFLLWPCCHVLRLPLHRKDSALYNCHKGRDVKESLSTRLVVPRNLSYSFLFLLPHVSDIACNPSWECSNIGIFRATKCKKYITFWAKIAKECLIRERRPSMLSDGRDGNGIEPHGWIYEE